MRPQAYRFGDYVLDLDAVLLRRGEQATRLQPKTFDVLLYLVERAGRLVTKQELLDAVWPGVVVTENSLTRCIMEARRALDDDVDAPRYVETVPRRGYRFLATPVPVGGTPTSVPPADLAVADAARAAEADAAVATGATGPVLAPASGAGARVARSARRRWPWVLAAAALLGVVALFALRPWQVVPKGPVAIAVLPFENLSGAEDARWFADGLAEDLLDLLARTPGLQVAARTSSFAYRDDPRGAKAIAAELGVRWLVQGSVRREGEVARVSVQLVDGDTGFQAWSGRFDRPLTQLLGTQDEIAGSVIAQVAPRLADADLPRASMGTANFEAYQSYMLGRDYLNRRPRGWAPQALAAYRRAIELDPDFAQPYAGVALVTAIGLSFADSKAAAAAEAAEAARRALELDPQLGLAHAALGMLALQQDDGERAEEPLRRALALDPQLTPAYAWLAAALVAQGRFQDARRTLEAGLQRDPLNPLLLENYGGTLAEAGDFEGSQAVFERLLKLPQPASSAYAVLRNNALQFGRLADALGWALEWERAEAERWPALRRVIPIGTYARLGDAAEVERRIAALGDGPLDGGWLGELELPLRSLGQGERFARLVETRLRAPPGPPALRQVMMLGRARALAGDWAGAVATLGPAFPSDQVLGTGADGGDMRADTWLWYVHALRRVGRDADAAAQLARLDPLLTEQRVATGSRVPSARFFQALTAAMAGRGDEALTALEATAAAGWTDAGLIRHDPRWGPLAGEPRFAAVLATIDARVAAERREVAARIARGDPRHAPERRP